MSNNVLEVKDLKVSFNVPGQGMWKYDNLQAVRGVSFNLTQGEILGIVGESGCGKSTLVRAILNLVPSSAGTVVWNDENVLTVDKQRMRDLRKEMQIIFQDPVSAINPRIPIGEIIAEPIKHFYPETSTEDCKQQVLQLFDEVSLNKRLYDRYAHEISGGQAQRIGIARALACNPKLLICDEPVSALDVSVQAQILNLLMRLRKERNLSMIFISHDLSVMRHICDSMIVLYLGQAVEVAAKEQLFNSPRHPYTKALLNAVPSLDGNNSNNKETISGEMPSPINPPSGCSFRLRCNYAKDECSKVVPILEEVSTNQMVSCIRIKEI